MILLLLISAWSIEVPIKPRMENRRGGYRFQLENNICLSQTHVKLAQPSKLMCFFENFLSEGFGREIFETFFVFTLSSVAAALLQFDFGDELCSETSTI